MIVVSDAFMAFSLLLWLILFLANALRFGQVVAAAGFSTFTVLFFLWSRWLNKYAKERYLIAMRELRRDDA